MVDIKLNQETEQMIKTYINDSTPSMKNLLLAGAVITFKKNKEIYKFKLGEHNKLFFWIGEQRAIEDFDNSTILSIMHEYNL